jgi:molybdopterin converting factor small subunit
MSSLARVRLFGEFRNFTEKAEIEISVAPHFTVQDLKSQLAAYLGPLRPDFDLESLLNRSAISDEERVLAPEEKLADQRWFALLPPVSGG